MMTKSKLKVIVICLLIFFCITASISVVNISATPENEESETTNVSLSTSNFYTEAIKSIDEDIRAKEETQDYIKNYSNSSVTALAYDLSLIDPDTIIMHAIGIIINIIEVVGSLISLVVLIAYNLASSSFWKTTVATIFNIFDQAFFNWSDSNSYFYKIVILFGLVAIIKKLLSSMKRIVTYKVFVSIIFQVLLSCILIVFIAQQGRTVVNYVDTLVNDSIATSFNFLSSQYEDQNIPLEINVKNQIFDIMQKQGFTLRHFGVTSADKIPNEYKNTYKGQDWVVKESGEARLQRLLNNPSTENARIERQVNGNDQIGYSGAQCSVILGESVVFLVHRILIGFTIACACIMLFGFSFMKEVSLSLSVYGLVFMLFKNEVRVASTWFMSRLKWTIMFIFINLAFNMFLSFMIIMINAISSQALLFLLIFDIVITISILYLIKNWHTIWEKITKDLGIDSDSTIIDAGKAILNGDISPRDVYNNHKERIANEREEREERKNKENNSSDDQNSSVSNIKSSDDLADKEIIEDQDDKKIDDSDSGEEIFDIDKEFNIDEKEEIGGTSVPGTESEINDNWDKTKSGNDVLDHNDENIGDDIEENRASILNESENKDDDMCDDDFESAKRDDDKLTEKNDNNKNKSIDVNDIDEFIEDILKEDNGNEGV